MMVMDQEDLRTGRSQEEINAILIAAKLDRKDLLPIAQEIAFSPQFSATEYQLMELPKELLETVSLGNRLVLRGDGNDHAVLCTDDSTFELKQAETSNSLLVLEQLAFPEQARRSSSSGSSTSSSNSMDCVSIMPRILMKEGDYEDGVWEDEIVVRTIKDNVRSYFELKKITPNLSRIRTVLANTVYKGPSEEQDDNQCEQFTLDKLIEIIPASVAEIKEFLKTIRVIEIDGCLRSIDDAYLFRVFSLVSGLVGENSWKINRIPKSVVIMSLISLEPPVVIDKVFDWFFYPCSEENDDIYCMKEDEICRFVGEAVLRTMARFNLSEFMKAWEQSVPEGLKIHLRQLEGSAVINRDVSPQVIWYFPEYSLPDAAMDRFAALFDAKPKWKLDEIIPFLRNLSSCQSIGTLLTKFARVSTVDGVKYYSSKHSK